MRIAPTPPCMANLYCFPVITETFANGPLAVALLHAHKPTRERVVEPLPPPAQQNFTRYSDATNLVQPCFPCANERPAGPPGYELGH